jgi:hypothetical protein
MKSIEMQQRKIMEDRRRRAERNQNLLADLNRINRQASILAAKSERMRILKVLNFSAKFICRLMHKPHLLFFIYRNNMNVI